MPSGRPAAPRRAAAFALAAAAFLAAALPHPGRAAAAGVPGDLLVRSEGRAPLNGRADAAYQQALDEGFRRALLAELPRLVPERQGPADLEVWQMTILARAPEFVAGWRVLSHEEEAGFLRLELEVGLWREKLAAAARGAGRGAGARRAPAVRVVVLAAVFPVPGPGTAEEHDAGRAAAAALEAELARRGAVIVAGVAGAAWRAPAGPGPEESGAPQAAAEARRLGADAAVLLELTALEGGRILLGAQLVAARSGTTLAAARAEAPPADSAGSAAALAPAARTVAAALAARLGGARRTEALPGPP